ncbi:MAG: DUF202 domain-containing protein [Chloroflexota bacterium]|nr:DUF202 domain-containing protein [Chloroflexota bacterium]
MGSRASMTGEAAPAERPVDPDSRARTHLANERTFLAWFRTGLTLAALGIAGAQLLDRDVDPALPIARLLSTGAIATGMVLVGVGAWRYLVSRLRIDDAAFRPASRSILLIAVGTIVALFLALAFVWLLPAV